MSLIKEQEINQFLILGFKFCTKCREYKPKECFVLDNTKTCGDYSSCKECNSERRSNYYQNNRERIVNNSCEWNQVNSDKRNERMRRAREESAEVKLLSNCRGRLWSALRLGGKKGARTMELMGCTTKELREYLVGKFSKDMIWDIYGSYWLVDHIKACASFELSIKGEGNR